MGTLNLTLPTVGQPVSTEDVDIINAFTAIQTLVNGNLDVANLANGASTAEKLAASLSELIGVTSGGVARSGYAEQLAEVTSVDATQVQDLGGPAVTVNVQTSGILQVLATVEHQSLEEGWIAQTHLCIDGVSQGTVLSRQQVGYAVAYTSATEAGTPLVLFAHALQVTGVAAGNRVVSLRYKPATAAGAKWKNRKLWVRAVKF